MDNNDDDQMYELFRLLRDLTLAVNNHSKTLENMRNDINKIDQGNDDTEPWKRSLGPDDDNE